MSFIRKKETLIILLLTILTTFFIISCSSKPAATQEAVKVEGLYSVSSTSTLASVTVKTISDYEDQIYLLYNVAETVTSRNTTFDGLYVLETVYGSISRAVETLNTAIAGADQIFALNDSLICIRDGKVISVDESGMLNWEIDDTGKTPLSLGCIKTKEDVQILTVLFQSGNSFTAALINTADGSVLSETPFCNFAASDDYYGPFEAVGKTMLLTKAEHYLLYDTNGVFITFNLDMDEKIIFIGTEGENSLYILTAMEENLYKITYNAEGEFLSRQQLAGNHTTLSRDLGINFTPLFDLPIQNPSSNAVYTLGNAGIANINPAGGDEPQDPPPNVNEPPTISFETQPPTEIQNDDGQLYGTADVSVISDQPLKFMSREVFLSNQDHSLFKDKQMLYTGQKTEDGKFRYTFNIQVQGGEEFQFTIQGIQEKTKNNESNTLSFTIRNNDTASIPELSFNGEKPLDEMTDKDTSAISVISNLPLDALIVKNNETSNKTDNPVVNALLKTNEGFSFEYVFDQSLVTGNNKITISGENETGVSSPVEATVFYNNPSVERPAIHWYRKKESLEWLAPIKITTSSTTTLRIASTQPLTKLIITVDGQPEVINTPQGTTTESDHFLYSCPIDLSDGTTTISVVGENEEGSSETLNHEIVKWFNGNDAAESCELATAVRPVYVVEEGTIAPIRFKSSKEIKTLSIISDQEQKILNYSQNGTGYVEVDNEGNFIYEISADMRDDSEEAMNTAFREFSLFAKGFEPQNQSSRAPEDHYDLVHQMYIAYYQRPADPAGLVYWAEMIDQYGWENITNSFANPDNYPGFQATDEDRVQAIYNAMFDREPTQEETNYWLEQNLSDEDVSFTIAGCKMTTTQPIKQKYSAEYSDTANPSDTIKTTKKFQDTLITFNIQDYIFHYEGITKVDKEKDGKKLQHIQIYGENNNGKTEKSDPIEITHKYDPPIISFPDGNHPPQSTDDEILDVTIQSDQPIATLTINVNDEPPTIFPDPGFVPVGDETFTLDTQINLSEGDNSVSIIGENENGSSEPFTFTVELDIPPTEPPSLSFPDGNHPPQSTDDETLEVTIISDQPIATLTINVNDEPPTIFPDPGFVPVGDETFSLDTQIDLSEGDNSVSIIGENENGSSEPFTFTVELDIPPTEPPSLSFPDGNHPPQSTDDETLEVTIISDQPVATLTINVNDDPPVILTDPGFVPVGDETFSLDTQIDLSEGDNSVSIVGENENGPSDPLTFTVELNIQPTEPPPSLSFPEDNQPPQTTTEEFVEFTIHSDQRIDTLTVTVNDDPPCIIDHPEPVSGSGGDSFLYYNRFDVSVGDNTIKTVGENENGRSNELIFNVERTTP